MPAQLFTFVQMELPWELGPADGRYLLRKPTGPQGGEPQHVVVLLTVGAQRRGLLGGRSRTRRTESEPAPVPVTRATVVDPVPLSADSQAHAWLKHLDPEHEARGAAGVLNRVLWAHRISGAEAHLHEISPAQALVVRAGFGEGEQVADGLWVQARELVLSRKRSGRRASVLRPQERLATLLSGRGSALLCEELVLRARLDLDAGRLALAAIELERAYAAALIELPDEGREDLQKRTDELQELYPKVERTARVAVPTSAFAVPTFRLMPEATVTDSSDDATSDITPGSPPASSVTSAHPSPVAGSSAPRGPRKDTGEEIDAQTVRHALERLEAALRARTATGLNM